MLLEDVFRDGILVEVERGRGAGQYLAGPAPQFPVFLLFGSAAVDIEYAWHCHLLQSRIIAEPRVVKLAKMIH